MGCLSVVLSGRVVRIGVRGIGERCPSGRQWGGTYTLFEAWINGSWRGGGQ